MFQNLYSFTDMSGDTVGGCDVTREFSYGWEFVDGVCSFYLSTAY